MDLHFILDAFREEEPGVSKKADAGFCIVVLKDASLVKARDVTQLVECLPSTLNAWVRLKLHIKLGVVPQDSPSIWEMQTGGSEIQGCIGIKRPAWAA